MKRYIRTSLIFALLLLTTSTSFSLPAFNDLCRSRGIPLPDKDADKIILPIEKPEIPEEPEIHEYSPRPEITEETVDYVVVLLPPIYKHTMYRYMLKDGRVFYTDVNYFPKLYEDISLPQIHTKTNYASNIKPRANQYDYEDDDYDKDNYDYKTEPTKEYKQAIPETNGTVNIAPTGKKYHNLTGCRTVRREYKTITLQQAKTLGYTPCGVCDPPIN